jgi:hypothetical protein
MFSVSGRSTLRERIYTFWRWLKTKALGLNFFETEASWDDHRRYEMTTTRIYILILKFAIIIVVVYTAIIVHSQSVTVENPSQSKFEDLVSNPQ